jgi:hypothetical protein
MDDRLQPLVRPITGPEASSEVRRRGSKSRSSAVTAFSIHGPPFIALLNYSSQLSANSSKDRECQPIQFS